MPKEEWGVKRVCPKCAVRFYDLKNDPMTCPSCGSTFDAASLVQQRTRSAAPAKVIKEESPDPKVDDLDADVDVLDTADDTAADDLGDDLLDDDDDDDVNLKEIADVPSKPEET